MDFAKGLVKLSGHIKSKKQLEIKLLNDPDNKVIKENIERHDKDIAFYKKALRFDETFDLGCENCKCDDDKNEILCLSAELDEKSRKISALEAEIACLKSANKGKKRGKK